MDIQTILLNLKIDQLNAMQEASIDAWKRIPPLYGPIALLC